MSDQAIMDTSNTTTTHATTTSHAPLHPPGASNIMNDPAPTSSIFPAPSSGNVTASGVSMLLADWSTFGLAERASYHFELIETLKLHPDLKASSTKKSEEDNKPIVNKTYTTTSTEGEEGGDQTTTTLKETKKSQKSTQNDKKAIFSGVVSLLECVPSIPPEQLNAIKRRQMRRNLRLHHRDFNERADAVRRNPPSLLSFSSKDTDANVNSTDEKRGSKEEFVVQNPSQYCYQPAKLPLPLSPSTRVTFVYELTSMVICLDASPSLTSMMVPSIMMRRPGHSTGNAWEAEDMYDSSPVVCAMDNFQSMVGTYLSSLVEPVTLSNQISSRRVWTPEIAVTIVAVYAQSLSPSPAADRGGSQQDHQGHQPNVSYFVKDYRIHDKTSVSNLLSRLGTWAMQEVESGIAARLHHPSNSLPTASSMNTILQVCDVALSFLPRQGRPCVVLATTCQSVRCCHLVDFASDSSWRDLPVHVLDLSSCAVEQDVAVGGTSARSHAGEQQPRTPSPPSVLDLYESSSAALVDYVYSQYQPSLLPPLCQSDDRESLYDFCTITGGSFLDATLLSQASQTRVGQVPPHSPLHYDFYLVFRRRSLRPNALQWYTLWSMSPLTPLSSGTWGRLPPPKGWLQWRKVGGGGGGGGGGGVLGQQERSVEGGNAWTEAQLMQERRAASGRSNSGDWTNPQFQPPPPPPPPPLLQSSNDTISPHQLLDQPTSKLIQGSNTTTTNTTASANKSSRTSFSVYSLSPVRVKSMLRMRFLEGFRAKKYGHTTQYYDKVSIHLTLCLDYGITAHYELSFVSSPHHAHMDPMVGSAHVKMELSGDGELVQRIKNDFISHQSFTEKLYPASALSVASRKLCTFLRWVRKEDCLSSYLCPLEWDVMNRPFNLKRLEALTAQQRERHFRVKSFEVLCVGGDALVDSHGILGAFLKTDHGEQGLFDAIESWATKTVSAGKLYVKTLSLVKRKGIPAYCFVQVEQPTTASRLLSIKVGCYGVAIEGRLAVLDSLKQCISCVEDVVVLPRSISRHLMLQGRGEGSVESALVESHYDHETWELLNDRELLNLLTRRRIQIGGFWLVEMSEKHALFAKLICHEGIVFQQHKEKQQPQDLALLQYQINIRPNHVTVDIHMDTRPGYFFPWTYRCHGTCLVQPSAQRGKIFNLVCKFTRRRDQDCGMALRSRSRLLRALSNPLKSGDDPAKPLSPSGSAEVIEDMKRLLSYSSKISKRLRFFAPKSGCANKILASLTAEFLLSEDLGGVEVARLSVAPDVVVDDQETGLWFLIRHDSSTITIVHFSNVDHVSPPKETEQHGADPEPCIVHRTMTFFSSGIGDLYSTKDDWTDDDTDDDDVSEHLDDVSEIVDSVEARHRRNFSRAMYLALRSQSTDNEASSPKFTNEDFAYGLSPCREVEVAGAFILPPNREKAEGLSSSQNESGDLSIVFGEILKPVPGIDTYFFFCGAETENDDCFADDVLRSDQRKKMRREAVIDDRDYTSENENIESNEEEKEEDEEDLVAGEEEHDADFETVQNVGQDQEITSPKWVSDNDGFSLDSTDTPPIFVKFLLEGKSAPSREIATLERGCHLTVLMTLFEIADRTYNRVTRSVDLPKIHAAFSIAMRSKLDSFVASQTLERLRHVGTSLSAVDVKVAMKCIVEAENVASRTVPVEFFSLNSDDMITVSNVREEALIPGFSLLARELVSGRFVKVKSAPLGAFYVAELESDSEVLSYWAFLHQNLRHSCICINVHSPTGLAAAQRIADHLEGVVTGICHRVNQLLLLDSLHATRSAHQLLIPSEPSQAHDVSRRNSASATSFDEEDRDAHISIPTAQKAPGHFACPVAFSTNFPLNHRCKRSQAILSLESSVLHPFAVSNRSGVFVYREETGHIFYLMLNARKKSQTNEEAAEWIELSVYGVENPGNPIRRQLTRLLRRKLMTLAVEALSSVLRRNPRYTLLPPDMAFIECYTEKWKELESEEEDCEVIVCNADRQRLYEFPSTAYDPLMILLYFRQNVSGSSYFHRLHVTGDNSQPSGSEGQTAKDGTSSSDNLIPYDRRAFSLFFNNTPTHLDLNFQAVSTLTSKGKSLSRQTGTGLALINVFLLDGKGEKVDDIIVGEEPRPFKSCIDLPESAYRFKLLDSAISNSERERRDLPFRLLVEIVNTTLKASVLHDWILLSLNQALTGWLLERHLDRSKLGLLSQALPVPQAKSIPPRGGQKKNHKNEILEHGCTGLPALSSILDKSCPLPHPAIQKIEMKSLQRASNLAETTCELLERAILGSLVGKHRVSLSDVSEVSILRHTTASCQPKLITFKRTSNGFEIIASGCKMSRLRDGPLDSPQYTCVFGLRAKRPNAFHDHQESTRTLSIPSDSKVFCEVFVDLSGVEGKLNDASLEPLRKLKLRRPAAFTRSTSFVLTVSRSTKTLLTYNWHPNVVQEARNRFGEVVEGVSECEKRLQYKQERRCLFGLTTLEDSSIGTQAARKEDNTKGLADSSKASSRENDRSRQVDSRIKGGNGDQKKAENDKVSTGSRKVERKTLIRRPRLIGQSVEGAAMQAVLASRARATARPVQAHRSRPSLSGGKSQKVPLHQSDLTVPKPMQGRRERQGSLDSTSDREATRKKNEPTTARRRSSSSASDERVVESMRRKSKLEMNRDVDLPLPPHPVPPKMAGSGRKHYITPSSSTDSSAPASGNLSVDHSSRIPSRPSFDTSEANEHAENNVKNRTGGSHTNKGRHRISNEANLAALSLLKRIFQNIPNSPISFPLNRRMPTAVYRGLLKRAESEVNLFLSLLPFAAISKTCTCQLPSCLPQRSMGTRQEDASSHPFLEYYIQILTKKLGLRLIHPDPASSNSGERIKTETKGERKASFSYPSIFLQKIETQASSVQADIIFLELTLLRYAPFYRNVVRCRVWIFTDVIGRHPNDRNRQKTRNRKIRRQGKTERLRLEIWNKLNLRSEVFNYASNILVKTMHSDGATVTLPMGSLVKETMKLYPTWIQRCLFGMYYRMYKKKINNIRLPVLSNCCMEPQELMAYLSDNASMFEMLHTSEMLIGEVKGTDTKAYIFLVGLGQTYELYTLCENVAGKSLDAVVSVPNTPIIQVRSERIRDVAESFVLATFWKAASLLRRDHIWERFAAVQASTEGGLPTVGDISDLCSTSSVRSITDTDSRLRSIIEECEDMKLNWSVVLEAMHDDPTLTTIYNNISDVPLEKKVLLVQFHEVDAAFLKVDVDSEDQVLQVCSIVKDGNDAEDQKKEHQVTELFVNWFLHWIWIRL